MPLPRGMKWTDGVPVDSMPGVRDFGFPIGELGPNGIAPGCQSPEEYRIKHERKKEMRRNGWRYYDPRFNPRMSGMSGGGSGVGGMSGTGRGGPSSMGGESGGGSGGMSGARGMGGDGSGSM
jgi:hypothetical protein